MKLRNWIYTATLGAAITLAAAPESKAQDKYFRAIGTPHNPKVHVSWNRYHTNLAL